MKSLPQQWRAYQWLLTALVTAFLVIQTSSVLSQETIENTATASGDNLPEVINSNNTTLQAGMAELVLVKTADRAAAEPGDTVVYRLALTNNGTAAATDIAITDEQPRGLNYVSRSLQGFLSNGSTEEVDLEPARESNRDITFTFDRLEAEQTLTVVYASVVTPDAVRGDGRNTAQEPRSNLASFRLRIRPGILSDCGTIIGRVFVDKDFDGEQQPGEPGVPNAVIFMDDGNRITTDANGLFSLANVIAGHRVGTLDLSSIPGYTLAPNRNFIEANSLSRLVRLEPSGMARMNFAVMPAYGEEQ